MEDKGKRKGGKKTAPAPSPTSKVVEDVKPVQAKKAEDTKVLSMKNVTNTWFVQPSSGTRIGAGQVRPLNNDGWLRSQVKAGFLAEEK